MYGGQGNYLSKDLLEMIVRFKIAEHEERKKLAAGSRDYA